MGIGSMTHQLERSRNPSAEKGSIRYTYAQVCAELAETSLPCELWEGEIIMSPAPSFYHQEVVLWFYRQLHAWVAGGTLGKVIAAPVDMVLSEHRVVQPDIAFVSRERLAIIQDAIRGPADLVAEVVSLGSRARDRIEKRDLYEQYGVKEYWIIDPESESADVLFLEGGVYKLAMRCGEGQTAQSRLLPGFQVPMKSLFQGE